MAHYHQARPYQALYNLTLSGPIPPPESDIDSAQVECHASLGGLLNSYDRNAA